MHKELKKSLVRLILKPQSDEYSITSYRPISHINTDLKLLGSTINRRLKEKIKMFIKSNQIGFFSEDQNTVKP